MQSAMKAFGTVQFNIVPNQSPCFFDVSHRRPATRFAFSLLSVLCQSNFSLWYSTMM